MYTVCFIGASTGWVPGLVTDLLHVFPDNLEIRFMDIDPEAAELCAEWGAAANRHWGRNDTYLAFTERRHALNNVDAVIIAISTGGLEAMKYDVQIPEKYGIFATVGDTAGPPGWSRSVRNIPVFREFADDFQRYCPKAFVANYTNPMSALTATLQHCCGNPVVGLCHSHFHTKDVIQKVFDLPDQSQISLSVAGMNHFTWVIDFRIGRENGYRLLRSLIGSGSLKDILPEKSPDEIGIYSGHELCAELYDMFGYLPYPGDRHTSEFVSFALTGNPDRYTSDGDASQNLEPYDTLRYCNIARTSVHQRDMWVDVRKDWIKEWCKGERPMPVRSRETGADMIRAYIQNEPFVDAGNVLNRGQVPGLPQDACVETITVVDGLGVSPVLVGDIPDYLLEIMRPQAVCQKWVIEGFLKADKNLLLQALYHDPLCSHLKPHEVRQMAEELLEANRRFVDENTSAILMHGDQSPMSLSVSH